MRKARRYGETGIKSDINFNPLVDVCLVLLIIFMVVTPLLSNAKVVLPETRTPDMLPEREGQLTVSIEADGNLSIGPRKVAETELGAALAEIHARSPEREVVVKGDRRLAYDRVRQVLRRVNAAGFAKAGLATEKRKS
jgi:biopolymer transport protein ExbD